MVLNIMQYVWACWSLIAAILMAGRGYKKRSLTFAGALAAMVVGFIHMFCGLQYGLLLIVFYLTSSKLTKVKADVKSRLQESHEHGGRGAGQVLSNSLGGCIFATLSVAFQPLSPAFSYCCQAAFLAHYACCCGDTWASEVGILSKGSPRLLLTLRQVPPGTNGGVSLLGTLSSASAGLVIGLTFWLTSNLVRLSYVVVFGAQPHPVRFYFFKGALPDALHLGHRWNAVGQTWGALLSQALDGFIGVDQTLSGSGQILTGSGQTGRLLAPLVMDYWLWVPAAAGMAVFGSVLDSLLGATLQFSGFDEDRKVVVAHPGLRVKHISGRNLLNNSMVNFVSAAVCSLATAALVYWLLL